MGRVQLSGPLVLPPAKAHTHYAFASIYFQICAWCRWHIGTQPTELPVLDVRGAPRGAAQEASVEAASLGEGCLA